MWNVQPSVANLCLLLALVLIFLGSFAKLLKAIVCLVRRSVRIEQLGSQWTDVHEI
jgi:hypothetical protein